MTAVIFPLSPKIPDAHFMVSGADGCPDRVTVPVTVPDAQPASAPATTRIATVHPVCLSIPVFLLDVDEMSSQPAPCRLSPRRSSVRRRARRSSWKQLDHLRMRHDHLGRLLERLVVLLLEGAALARSEELFSLAEERLRVHRLRRVVLVHGGIDPGDDLRERPEPGELLIGEQQLEQFARGERTVRGFVALALPAEQERVEPQQAGTEFAEALAAGIHAYAPDGLPAPRPVDSESTAEEPRAAGDASCRTRTSRWGKGKVMPAACRAAYSAAASSVLVLGHRS